MAEPKIVRVTIQTSGGVTVFNPETLNINLNDSVYWVNQTSVPHQPAPDSGGKWMPSPIPPNGESPQVVFDDPVKTTTKYPYHCAEAGHNEKGVIVVNVSS